MKTEIRLDGLPPTINNYYGYGRSTVYKKEAAREWQERVTEEMRREWDGNPELINELELRIIFITKSHRKWDIDNRIKPLQDCLERAGVIKNDNQIEVLHVMRKTGASEETYIELTEL